VNTTRKNNICTLCFLAVIILGLGFLALGVVVIPTLPYFQLDAVLSPEELADPQVQDATLSLLKKAGGNQWLMWSVAGVMLCIIGGIGMLASLQARACSEKSRLGDELP
jgi:hypothetical protein